MAESTSVGVTMADKPLWLGIEIGGTKLQLGVGPGDFPELTELVRLDVDRSAGADGILNQIAGAGRDLLSRHNVEGLGVAFGGPVDSRTGVVIKSHHVEGWADFPLGDWIAENLGMPASIANDCNCAALAEAMLGAGTQCPRVFYVTVGTGIGGGFVIDGKPDGIARPAVSEIGHLRPGLVHVDPEAIVESISSGMGIEKRMKTMHGLDLSCREIAERASSGDVDCGELIIDAVQCLGWAIAQVITLTAPDVIVVGGGVSLMGDDLFYRPLKHYVAQYVMPPLLDTYQIRTPVLGEEVVVHGALCLSKASQEAGR